LGGGKKTSHSYISAGINLAYNKGGNFSGPQTVPQNRRSKPAWEELSAQEKGKGGNPKREKTKDGERKILSGRGTKP